TSASRIRTPGMIGRSGKWSARKSSLIEMFLTPTACVPVSSSRIESTSRNLTAPSPRPQRLVVQVDQVLHQDLVAARDRDDLAAAGALELGHRLRLDQRPAALG